uniref:RNA-dependent RNA polymerase n=1 Tax=Panagrolaimus davidi TaxID=227884 RepID=A0A914QD39_9BILA
MYDHLKGDPTLTSLEFVDRVILIDNENDGDDNYVQVKTVYVTPTRIIPIPDEWTLASRGLRYLGVHNVVQVKFRDENLSWFPHDLGNDIITPTCRSGIAIANKVFHEFGGSNSSFREFSSYFYATENKDEILQMYKKLGTFEPATAAKLSARIGQYFTSAWKTRMQLRQINVCLINDITSMTTDAAGNHYCFTDGNGIMSYLLAVQIAEHLEIPYVPSAFQIRFAGYKGMLTVAPKNSKNIGGPYYPKLIENDGPYHVLFRKSQKKFDVKGDGLLDFDIVQWSSPSPFNIYRSFITVLDYLACKDGKQQIMRDRLRLLNNSFSFEIIKPLIDNRAFLAKLEELPTYCPISKMVTKNLMDEPFWRGIVEASVVEDAKNLANKIQISLPAKIGRTAFGIADYTRKLKANQIFFQYSKKLSTKQSNKNPMVKIGRVGITKSPVVHPGDIRFYEAVDIPELQHLIDVVVFPTVGDRPIPDEIGGGDLDGDPYGIFWEEDLLMSKNFDATDFTDLDSDKANKITLDELQEEQAKFRSEYLKKRTIEFLSSSYLAVSLTQDLDSYECRSMRSSADKAVNYAKSGIFGRQLNQDEKQIFWPDFMEKDHEPAYKTNHIICELYEKNLLFFQRIKNVSEEAEKRRTEEAIERDNEVNPAIRMLFEDYKKQIQTIMTKHQIKTEGELFSNAITSASGTLEEKTCYSFPWLLREGLDIWLRIDQGKNQNTTAAIKVDNDFLRIYGSSTLISEMNNGQIVLRMRQRTQSETFTKMVKIWANFENLEKKFYLRAIITYLQYNIISNENHTAFGGEAFMAFLVSKMQNQVDNQSELQKAAQSALIKLAFLPSFNFFKEEPFGNEIIKQQCIVLNIPKSWEVEFQQKYGILKEISGCQNIAISIRKAFTEATKFSVMFRGTLESCQKLKSMLTPLIKETLGHSLKNTKNHIIDESNKILMDIFNFRQILIHSHSAPNWLNNGNTNQSRARRNKKINTVPRYLNN